APPSDLGPIYLHGDGRPIVERGGDVPTPHPDDIALLDGRRPFRADFSAGGRRAVAKVPRQMLDHRAPWLGRRPLHRIPAGARFPDFARDHMIAPTPKAAPPA